MLQIPVPIITTTEAEKFSKTWDYNGVVVNLDSTTLKFATDFANIVVKSYVQFLGQVLTIPAQAKQEIAPLEPEKSSIIIEG